MSVDRIIPFSKSLTAYIHSLPFPIAVVPPALSELFSYPVSNQHLREAFLRIGFADVQFVADHWPHVISDLSTQAQHKKTKHSFFTACPAVDEMLKSRRNTPSLLRLQVDPPAARAAHKARKSHPEGILFFISPCSARGRTLDVDHEIPLHTIFPTLSEALSEIRATPPVDAMARASFPHTFEADEIPGLDLDAAKMDYAILDDTNDILAFLNSVHNEEPLNGNSTQPVVRDFIGCRRGCSYGDWSPRTQGCCQAC